MSRLVRMLSNSCISRLILTEGSEHGKPAADELEMVSTCVVSISIDRPPCLSLAQPAVPVLVILQTATAVLSRPEPLASVVRTSLGHV